MDVKSLPFFQFPGWMTSGTDQTTNAGQTAFLGKLTQSETSKISLRTITDVFEKSPDPIPLATDLNVPSTDETDATEPTDAVEKADQTKNSPAVSEAGGLKVSMQFNLFYELSQTVSAKMGQKGLNRFTEVASEVTQTFKERFSLKIDGVGSFMKGTDSALKISPEATNEFLDSVEDLSELSPEALQNFLQESEEFFGEIEKTYGDQGGIFDTMRDQVQEQAKAFFADVKAAQKEMLAGVEEPEAVETEGDEAVSDTQEASGKTALIPLATNPDTKLTPSQYQDFLQGFQDYVRRFRGQMLHDFLKMNNLSQNLHSQKKVNDALADISTSQTTRSQVSSESSVSAIPESKAAVESGTIGEATEETELPEVPVVAEEPEEPEEEAPAAESAFQPPTMSQITQELVNYQLQQLAPEISASNLQENKGLELLA